MLDIMSMLSGTKSALEIIKALQDIKTNEQVTEKTVQLHQIILQIQQQLYEMQAENMNLITQLHQLQAQIQNAQNWENEKQNYQIFQYPTGTIVYRPISGNFVYDLCANCFEAGRKSILQPKANFAESHCPNCHTKIETETGRLATFI